MRKFLVGILVVVLSVGLLAPTAVAKKKKITDSWTAQALPYPPEVDSCQNGIEGVHVVNHELKTPGKGVLDVTMTGYVADWDLWVFDPNGNALGSSIGFVDVPTERVVVPIRGMDHVIVLACNFLGGPTAELESVYIYS
ncbi:MAG TPA: hypothetical protein VHJ82_01825 [Actinomycetota bacterium]|nr:hypothetical protein [Actinomycetota bacterium]